ncbi:MAG TPA: sulfite exporter TauE/SafE family protein [Stellaceae bacterium]|nr:sulfite exporter TauE/SafE family protein [Stellaceae bacterium]
MSFLTAINPLFTVSGFAVGMLVGLTGVGGGSLMTPLLVLLFGTHPATAVGTDLLYACITKVGGSLVHNSNRTIDWRLVGRLASGSVPATAITLLTASQLGYTANSSTIVSMVLGVALLLTAVSLIFRRQIMQAAIGRANRLSPRQITMLTVATGAVLGVLVSISSVGAGALGITALIFLYPGIPIKTIVGSDIAHAVPLTLIAGLGHWMMGTVDWTMLFALVIGSLPGIFIGAHLSSRVPEAVLRPILAVTLLIVGAKLAFQPPSHRG